jgi:hypothetical protein
VKTYQRGELGQEERSSGEALRDSHGASKSYRGAVSFNRIFPYADRVLRLEDGCMARQWVPGEGPAGPAESVGALNPEQLRFLKEQAA